MNAFIVQSARIILKIFDAMSKVGSVPGKAILGVYIGGGGLKKNLWEELDMAGRIFGSLFEILLVQRVEESEGCTLCTNQRGQMALHSLLNFF